MQNINDTYLSLMGQQIDPRNVASLSDGIYFKMSGGEKMRMFLKGGQWVNPLAQAQEGDETEEKIYGDHDEHYDYKIVNGQWQTKRKNSEGDWIDLSTNDAANTKLNDAYPDAMSVIDESANNDNNDGVSSDDLNSIVDDSGGSSDGLQLNKDNLKFASPAEGNVFSALGDTGILDIVKAVDSSVDSFKSKNYQDPGSKSDYSKFSHTNTTDEDLYVDYEALSKGKRTGKVLKDAEQMSEIEMQRILDERHKNNPEMYDKVKNFDADLYEQTGHLDRRRGLFNRKVDDSDLKDGDYLDNKYGKQGASHIGFTKDKMGKLDKGFDYLKRNEDGVTFDQQSFDGYQNPNSGLDDSREYSKSDKHNEDFNYSDYGEDFKNAGINPNMNLEDDDPYAYTKQPGLISLPPKSIEQIPVDVDEPELMLSDPTNLYADNIEKELRKSQGPPDFTDPQTVINYNDQMSLDEANQRYANNLNGLVPRARPVGPREDGRGLQLQRNGGDLPKAQYNVSDNIYNQNPIVHAAESTGVVNNYIDPNVDMSGYTKHNNPDLLNKMTYGLFGESGGHYKTPTTPAPETESYILGTDGPKVIGGNMPFVGTGPQLIGTAAESVYDYFSPEGGTFGDFMGWSDKKYGGDLPKAQNGLNEFCTNAPIINSGGKVFAQCRNRDYDSEHDFELGAAMSVGKLNDEFTSSFKGTAGYTFNPSGGTGGFKGYLGANYGKRATALGDNNVNMDNISSVVLSGGYTGEMGGNSYNWQTPTQYEFGAYADKDLIGDNGTTFGGYGRLGLANAKIGYNANTGPQFSIGLGLPIKKQGGSKTCSTCNSGELEKAQFGKDKSGYNPLTNQYNPINFNTNIQHSPISMDMFEGQSTPPEKTEPFFNSQENMYAMNQSVDRSMDSWDAFSSDMNKRMQNPSLQMNQIDTNPLNVPDFSNPELNNQIQMNQDRMAFKNASEDGRVIGGNIIPTKKETRQNQKEFGNQLDQTVKDGPFGDGYKGTKKNLRRFDRSNELGFDGDLVKMDEYDQNETEEGIKRSLREDQLNEDNKDANPSFGDKLWNEKNRLLDSNVGQTLQKGLAAGVNIAKPVTSVLRKRREKDQNDTQMNNAYLSDNMFASRDADLSGSKGDYDVNSGIFRAEDKITTRQGKYGAEISNYLTFAKNGGSFFNDGGEAEIDANMYKELIAAGAELEIL